MDKTIYRAECRPDDEFAVESTDKQEVIDMLKKHAMEQHNLILSNDDASTRIKII